MMPIVAVCLFQCDEIFLDGGFQSHVECIADECMSDAHLIGPRNARMEIVEVFERKVMAGVET